jgi:hypothetical protein
MQNSPGLSRRALPAASAPRPGSGSLLAEKYSLVPDAAEEFRSLR